MIAEYNHETYDYRHLMLMMDSEMTKGLSKKYCHESTMKMLITYIQTLPDGTGKYKVIICILCLVSFEIPWTRILNRHRFRTFPV